MKKILDVSIALSAEKDPQILHELILNIAMDITNCDAGTMYIKDGENLEFKIMITRSMGGKMESVNLPPVKIHKDNVCACALIENKTINLKNVHESNLYDFSGPKKYGELIGYKTVSMLVVPMTDNKGESIGVIQLINAMDDNGEIIAFESELEYYVSALTSQAAISQTNTNQQIEIENLLLSLVRALSTAIYERTPYNVTHTQNMTVYAEKFIDWLNNNTEKYNFTFEKKRQFIMSVWLHDVGKLIVPLEVMNKENRLSTDFEKIMTRFEIIDLTAKLAHARGESEYLPVKEKLDYARETIQNANVIPYLHEELEGEIKKIAEFKYIDADGISKNWLTDSEVKALTVKAGTLTVDERKIMETHVVMTTRILDEVTFGKDYNLVAKWAGEHHEFLDGSGYPKKIHGDMISAETRMLTILDVFDGLSAKDRPYKKPIPIDRVFEILYSMAKEGKVDEEILRLFEESRAWEN